MVLIGTVIKFSYGGSVFTAAGVRVPTNQHHYLSSFLSSLSRNSRTCILSGGDIFSMRVLLSLRILKYGSLFDGSGLPIVDMPTTLIRRRLSSK